MMAYNVETELLRALERDGQLAFKRTQGQYMTGGTCPGCGKKELYISTAKPYVLACNRANNCGYSETTRERYPELFTNFSERFPATRENKQATADAFMSVGRGFPLAKVGSWYTQEKHQPKGGKNYDTVRFYFDAGKTRYWERLIDASKDEVKQRHNIDGRRKSIPAGHADYEFNGTLYKGECWAPPGQTVADGETVWWVEGIFHAIALHLAGKKVIAAIAANNFPELWLRDYYGKKITWVLALDDDKAGHEYINKHRKKLLEKNEGVQVALAGQGAADWDDLYKEGKLDDAFFAECLHNGALFTASSIMELSWLHHCKSGIYSNVLPFKNKWWAVKTRGDDLQTALADADVKINSPEGKEKFRQYTKTESITNCLPNFIYCEQNTITQDILYFFQIDFAHGAPKTQVALPGSSVESAASFNKALLNTAAGATFDGEAWHMKRLRERWFNHRPIMVQAVPFVGYDRASRTYLYQDFAFHSGRALKPTPHAYFNADKTKIKTTFRGFKVANQPAFSPGWFNDFVQVFGKNGVVALAFWLGSLFAEQIRNDLGHKSFPFLEMTGQAGTGKSTLIEFLWTLLGRDDHEGFDPGKSTFAARARAFSQVSNMPVVLIEGDHESGNAKKGAFDFDELKTAFNGRAIRSTGSFTRGNETEEPPFRGTIAIAQNAEVDGSEAILSRIVHLHFAAGAFTAESARKVLQFKTATAEKMAGFLQAALKQETQILQAFQQHFERIQAEFQQPALKSKRVVDNHAQIAALCHCLPLLFPDMTPARCEQITAFVLERAHSRQARLEADQPQIQQFWEIYDLLNVRMADDESYIEQHMNHATQDNEIAINLPQYLQECAKQRVDAPHMDSLKKLLPSSRQRKFIGIKTVRSRILKKTIKCWVFENKPGEKP